MTCPSCELLLERKLSGVPGVARVDVHHKTGTARITSRGDVLPDMERIASVIEEAGYSVIDGRAPSLAMLSPDKRKWMEIGASILVIFALYKLLAAFDLVALAPAASGALSVGGIFLIGLVAGTSSCLAVTGGLLLALAAKHNELHQAETPWQKFRPLLQFNIGRLISYFVLGGLVGLLGRSITLSTSMTGYVNIAVALIMLYLALSILNIIPKGMFPLRPPKKLSRRIAELSESDHPAAPLALGAFTFFLPCGFTQSLQLAALASGHFVTGAAIMFTFALGTLPSLIGISALSSSLRGRGSRWFLHFTGTVVLVLAFWNLQSGFRLIGVDATFSRPPTVTTIGDPNVTIDAQGRQILYLHVVPEGYEPSAFTIEAGRETWVYARGEGAYGCQTSLTSPSHNLAIQVQEGDNWLGPIHNPTRSFLLTCSMGMYKVNVNVVAPS